MPHYYVETDGEVFLVERGGRLRFPVTEDELPFPVRILHEMRVDGELVYFCKPEIAEHPRWHHKDALIGRDEADPLVRRAVNASLPRLVTEAVVVEEGHVLLVKSSRGFNRGRWTPPGGFVSYGESPAEATAREVREEVGVACEIGALLGFESFIGRDNGFHWTMSFYETALLSHDFAPPADEIEEVRWFSLEESLRHLAFPNLQRVIRKRYLK